MPAGEGWGEEKLKQTLFAINLMAEMRKHGNRMADSLPASAIANSHVIF